MLDTAQQKIPVGMTSTLVAELERLHRLSNEGAGQSCIRATIPYSNLQDCGGSTLKKEGDEIHDSVLGGQEWTVMADIVERLSVKGVASHDAGAVRHATEHDLADCVTVFTSTSNTEAARRSDQSSGATRCASEKRYRSPHDSPRYGSSSPQTTPTTPTTPREIHQPSAYKLRHAASDSAAHRLLHKSSFLAEDHCPAATGFVRTGDTP